MGYQFPIVSYGDRYCIEQKSYEYKNGVWLDNELIIPEHHWKFNENSGNIYVSDSGSIPKALVATGTTSITFPTLGNSGKINKSSYFSGNNVARFESYSAEAVTLSAITISHWFKTNASTLSGLSYSRYQDGSNYVYVGFTVYDDPPTSKFRMNFGGVVVDYNTTINDNNWHHFVSRYRTNGTSGIMDYFVDGVHVLSSGVSHKVISFSATTNRNDIGMHWIGNFNYNSSSNPLLGYAEDVRVYYKAISDLDIFNIYHQGRGTQSQCLVSGYPTYNYPRHHWKFYENTQEGTSIKISDSGTLPLQLNYSGLTLNINESGVTIDQNNTHFYGNGFNESYSALTVSFWIKNNFDQLYPTDEIIVIHYTGSTLSDVIKVSLNLIDDNAGISLNINGNSGLNFQISTGDFSHFVITYDGFSNVTLYKNTISMYNFTNITGVSNFLTNSNINLLRLAKNQLSNTNTLINDVRLYNYCLTKEEIENLYYLGIQNKIT